MDMDMNRSLIFGVFRCNNILLNLNQNQAKHVFVQTIRYTVILNGEITTNVSRRLLSFICVPAMICAYVTHNSRIIQEQQSFVCTALLLVLKPFVVLKYALSCLGKRLPFYAHSSRRVLKIGFLCKPGLPGRHSKNEPKPRLK